MLPTVTSFLFHTRTPFDNLFPSPDETSSEDRTTRDPRHTRRDGVQSDRGRLREENQQIQRTRRSGGERDVHEPQAVLSSTSSAFLWPHVHIVNRHHYTPPPLPSPTASPVVPCLRTPSPQHHGDVPRAVYPPTLSRPYVTPA